jgi:divalent metal cation (Fe/Co/Zn/Cd) transporter
MSQESYEATGGEKDPGWRRSLVGVLLFMPGVSMLFAQRRADRVHGLVLLRTVFLSFASALVFVGIVVSILDATSSESVRADADQELAVAVVVLVGVAGIAVSKVIERRPLDCESDQALAESYRKSFFLRIALAELAALVAFVAYFLAGRPWLYLLGAAFTAVGFARLAPTAGHLARYQDDLARSGCPRSLSGALRRLPFKST